MYSDNTVIAMKPMQCRIQKRHIRIEDKTCVLVRAQGAMNNGASECSVNGSRAIGHGNMPPVTPAVFKKTRINELN
jgi:hypothetical protein